MRQFVLLVVFLLLSQVAITFGQAGDAVEATAEAASEVTSDSEGMTFEEAEVPTAEGEKAAVEAEEKIEEKIEEVEVAKEAAPPTTKAEEETDAGESDASTVDLASVKAAQLKRAQDREAARTERKAKELAEIQALMSEKEKASSETKTKEGAVGKVNTNKSKSSSVAKANPVASVIKAILSLFKKVLSIITGLIKK